MFSPEERQRLRSGLLEAAANDRRLTGGAITGSASVGREDRWSDIDLAFGVAGVEQMPNVLSDWTARMYDEYLALHHVDMIFGAWVYRVFLLPGTLQVDLAFVPANEFRALEPTFSMVFGSAAEALVPSKPDYEKLVGMGWLYALHARTCIARKKLWQAEYMISGTRNNALALACLRNGLPIAYGRGMDRLPNETAAQFVGALVRHLDTDELARALRVAICGLLSEIRSVDRGLAERLQATLISLAAAPS
jgi:hypothetical protein